MDDTRLPRLMTVDQAAEYLGVSPWTLYRWSQQHTGPTITRVGGRAIRYATDDLLAYLESNRQIA